MHTERAQLLGIDWDGPIADADDEEEVSVPITLCPISEEDFEDLQSAIPSNASSDMHGIDHYISILSYVRDHFSLYSSLSITKSLNM